MSNSNKYGDPDALVGSDDELPGPSTRKRRPHAALNAMQGNKPAMSFTQEVQLDLEETKKKLELALNANAELENKISTSAEFTREMPVSKKVVTFVSDEVNADLIDVSAQNDRIQEFLDEISLGDILPSIEEQGQQYLGMLRPKGDGRFELIEGSRRLKCAKILGRKYKAWIGEVPDEDVAELAEIENKKIDVSHYEKAVSYRKKIEQGVYADWESLKDAKRISKGNIYRYKQLAELDDTFVKILPSPSDMQLNYGGTVVSLLKKNSDALKAKAEELLKAREEALQNKKEFLDSTTILQLLRKAADTVNSSATVPTEKKPVPYASNDGSVKMKHSVTNKGATKFQIEGADEDLLESIRNHIVATLKLKEERKS